MPNHYYIGVDGGASKSIVRIENAKGELLGRQFGGPANIRLSVKETWEVINANLLSLLSSLNLFLQSEDLFHVGMGLAGCEVKTAYQAFINTPHLFTNLAVTSDAHTACLGAHSGKEGAIIIAGTGVVGFQIEKGEISKVGGFGFPHDDEGGGAWLGLQAINATLKWQDKRAPASALSKALYHHFNDNLDNLIEFANSANSTAFASLAPLVIDAAKLKDPSALTLLKKAGFAIDEIANALILQTQNKKSLPTVLLGGLAPFLKPYVGAKLQANLHDAQKTPDEGAILFLHYHLKQKQERYA